MWSIFAILTLNYIPLLLLSAFLFICYVSLHRWKNRDYYKKLSKFNSNPTVPIFGNMLPVLLNCGMGRKSRMDLIMEVAAQYDTSKPLVFWLFHIPIVAVTTYEDIQIVSNKSHWRNVLGKFVKILGDGIGISHPDKWRNVRRMINPAFGPAMLQQYLLVFNQQSKILCRRLNEVCDSGKVVDLFKYMGDLNLNIITENMAGIDLQLQEKGDNVEFSESLATALLLENSRFFEPWLFPDSIFYLYLLLTGQKDLHKKLHKLPSEVVTTKLAEYKHQKEKLKNSNDPISDRPVKTYVDILVRLHDTVPEFTQQQIHDEIITMIGAGSESTAVVTSFTLLMLAMHQDAQQKVYEEITQIFGKDPSRVEVRMEDLMGQKCEYLDKCIKETLRLYTLTPLMLREATEEIILSDGNVIPVGTTVVMAYFLLHRDPSIYPEPEKWDPEHFSSDENVKHTFVPFGLGARACIGSKYAMVSMKTQIIHVLRRFHLSTSITLEDIELEYDIIIRKKDGYPVTIALR